MGNNDLHDIKTTYHAFTASRLFDMDHDTHTHTHTHSHGTYRCVKPPFTSNENTFLFLFPRLFTNRNMTFEKPMCLAQPSIVSNENGEHVDVCTILISLK